MILGLNMVSTTQNMTAMVVYDAVAEAGTIVAGPPVGALLPGPAGVEGAITVKVVITAGGAEITVGEVIAGVDPEVTVEVEIVTEIEIGAIGIAEEAVKGTARVEAAGDVVVAAGALVGAGLRGRPGRHDTVVAGVEVTAGAEVMEKDRHLVS
mmetsp:Transcript_4184/g.11537  ORF Transcript_4184/g.11537 Transcript_4184/m.11537 type:complete len:153 (+) Transcript_4184:3409-3867(+)